MIKRNEMNQFYNGLFLKIYKQMTFLVTKSSTITKEHSNILTNYQDTHNYVREYPLKPLDSDLFIVW